MPELPEVETVRRGLQAELAGQLISEVVATGARTTRRHTNPGDLAARVEGQRIERFDRVGKYILGRVSSRSVVVIHLGMSGQLLLDTADSRPPKHTHVRWRFASDERELRFVDPRTFGEVWAAIEAEDGSIPDLAHLGPDALNGIPIADVLEAIIAGRRRRLKPLLMDQRVIAGIGNLYADEILFAAGIHSDRIAASLSGGEIARMHSSMKAILSASIDAGGSSLADEQYRDLYGQVGSYQKLHSVYAREGNPCLRCSTVIVRAKWAGRSSFTCPSCQTLLTPG